MKSVITHVYCHCTEHLFCLQYEFYIRDVDLTLAGNIPLRGDSRIKIRHRGERNDIPLEYRFRSAEFHPVRSNRYEDQVRRISLSVLMFLVVYCYTPPYSIRYS